MISIRDFSFTYKGEDTPALSGINLEIEDGDFIGIIGGSGAGKTTLAHSICAVIPHYRPGDFYGSITVNGMDTIDTPPEEISKITACVMQDIDSQMTTSVVEDEILFGLENFSVPAEETEQRITEALEEAGIPELRYRSLNTLSGGQKQKAAIAAIIALKPKILILDEPTGELDPQSSVRIFKMLRRLNEEHGVTVIVIEQKIMLLCEYAKKLAVLNKGKLLEYGFVREVLKSAEKLKETGVSCPRVTDISEELRRRSLYSGPAAVNVEEAAEIVKGVCEADD